jgi:hypothetical protein
MQQDVQANANLPLHISQNIKLHMQKPILKIMQEAVTKCIFLYMAEQKNVDAKIHSIKKLTMFDVVSFDD